MPLENKKRIKSFGQSLRFHLAIGVVILGGILLISSILISKHVERAMLKSLTARVLSLTEAQFADFLRDIHRASAMTEEGMKLAEFSHQALTLEELLPELDKFFVPLISAYPQLSSAHAANCNGNSYMLLKTPGGWKSRVSKPDIWGKCTFWREFTAPDEVPTEAWKDTDYDARNRPWFKGALDLLRNGKGNGNELFWTEPYVFFTTQEPGITASIASTMEQFPCTVLAFDVLLKDISHFTQKLRIGRTGMVFAAYGDVNDLKLVGLPSDRSHIDPTQYLLKPVQNFGGPISDFVNQAVSAGWDPGEPFSFQSGGEVWWGEGAISKVDLGQKLWIGAVVPQEELLEGIPDPETIVVIATAVVLAFVLLRAFSLARTYSHPMELLVEQGQRMQRLNFQTANTIHSDIQEINQLGGTLENMRQALFSYTAEREDIRIARSIHSLTVPADLAQLPGFEIAGWRKPSTEIGGDGYDLVPFWGDHKSSIKTQNRPPDGAVILFYSALSFGVEAATTTLVLRGIFRVGIRLNLELHEILQQMNRYLRSDLPHIGITRTWLGLLNCHKNSVSMISAGQHLLHYSAQAKEFNQLEQSVEGLGFEDHLELSHLQTLELEPNDILVVLSEGVLSSLNRERYPFSIEKVKELITQHIEATATEMLGQLGSALEAFTRTAASEHDQTILIIKHTVE